MDTQRGPMKNNSYGLTHSTTRYQKRKRLSTQLERARKTHLESRPFPQCHELRKGLVLKDHFAALP